MCRDARVNVDGRGGGDAHRHEVRGSLHGGVELHHNGRHLSGALRGQVGALGRAEGRAAHVRGADVLRQGGLLHEGCKQGTQQRY